MIRAMVVVLPIFASVGTAGPVVAQFQDLPEQVRQRLLERFDENRDGELTGTELERARQAWAQRRQSRQGADSNRNQDNRNQANRNQANRARQGNLDRAELIKRFDKNGDGQLDNTERQAARTELEKLRERFGTDANGQIRRRFGNRDAAPPTPPRDRLDMRALIGQFDADGDGRLSPEEREKARDEIRKRRDK